ncbi:DUF4393 domain-containing protein [Bradyrhizobium sp. URHD0069]|uniref:DUF4393 domain-containing protein n=1 Tax=Bradyrhizobium sp. URHD0069 TaxID=1380355 RepID=UPI0006924928|nr:DUF4393 domain-containing protein [Bradyrhizobium sp. URHD0069]
MTEPLKDPTAAFAEELAKQLPVKAAYRDVVKPGAKQAGQMVQDLVKTIQLALAPLQFAGAYQDRLRSFIDRSVRGIPEADRVSPPPQILGPIVEGIRYEPEGTSLDGMFSELLSSSMDATRLRNAHPAFVAIIKSLSPDEAKLLISLADQPVDRVSWSSYDKQRNFFDAPVVEQMAVPDDLSFPENISVFLEHLQQLGLVQTIALKAQEPTFAGGAQNGVRHHERHQLTGWGRQFICACTAKKPAE